MATSGKKTRRGISQGFETIILKDLQSLQRWNLGHLQTSKAGYENVVKVKSSDDCDRLRCYETLDDLDDVWATPTKPKRAKKSKVNLKLRKNPLKSSSASPMSHWAAPPNSPADFPVRTEQAAGSNPYISYLMRSWDPSMLAVLGPPAALNRIPPPTSTNTRHSLVSPHRLQDDRESKLFLPSDSLVIPDSAADYFTASVPHGRPSQIGVDSDFIVPVLSDDLLVIPNLTMDEVTRVPGRLVLGRDDEQQVPGQEGDLGQSLSDSQDDYSGSFFVEDGFMPLDPCQPSPCEADHVVPTFDLEE